MTFRIAVASFLMAGATIAQVPDGWAVVSTFKTFVYPTAQNPFQGDGGLFFVHPRQPGSAIAVTGLPPGLTGQGRTSGSWGANCVARHSDDETLFVGEVAEGSVNVHLHRLTLRGSTVVARQFWSVGQGAALEAQISDIELLANGSVLVAVDGIGSGPLAGTQLGLVDPATNSVVPLPNTPAIGGGALVNAVALDATGTTIYVGVFQNTNSGSIWSLPAGGGPPTWIANLSSGVMSLERDNDGTLLAGLWGSLVRVDPATGGVTVLLNPALLNVYNAGWLVDRAELLLDMQRPAEAQKLLKEALTGLTGLDTPVARRAQELLGKVQENR